MLSPRWMKILRELWRNKLRTVLVILSIAVGVFAIGLVSGAQAILARELLASYRAINPANAILTTSLIDDDLIAAVRRMPAVQDAEGRRNLTLRLETGPEEWRDLYLFVIPDYNDIRINRVQSQSGAWPPPKHELLIERAALSLTKAKVGDTVLIQTPDLKQRALRIAGLVHDESRQPATLEGTAYGYITSDTLEWLGLALGYNELDITVASGANDREHIRLVGDLVRERLERSGAVVSAVSVPEPGKPPLEDTVQAVILLLGVFGVFSLILSSFLVVNTLSAVLAQQVRQIGMMKAVGARTYQIAAMYLSLALSFGLCAVIIAAPLGIIAARAAATLAAALINSDLADLSIPFSVLSLQIIVGLVVPLLAALYPVLSGTRVSVREAISDYGLGQQQFGTGRLDRGLERLRGLPRPLLLSLRNTFRRKGRLLLTLSTLTLGSAFFIAVTSVYDSAQLSIQDIFRYWQYDVQFYLDPPRRTDLVLRQVLSTPGVVKAEQYSLTRTTRVYPDDREGGVIYMYAVPAETLTLQPKLLAGRWLLPQDENAVVMSNKFLDENPDVKIGDQVVLRIQGEEKTWRVVGTVHMLMTDGPTIFVNYPYFARIMHRLGTTEGVRIVTAQHDAAFQSEVARAVEQRFRSMGLRITSMVQLSDVQLAVEEMFVIVVALLLMMAVLLVAVGGLGLMGIMSLNVLERQREIGVMRAIGASGKAILQIILSEGMLIGLLSWVLGSLLALPLSQLLSEAVGLALMQTPFTYAYSLPGAFLWFVLVILVTALASALPARAASRLAVRQVLAYE